MEIHLAFLNQRLIRAAFLPITASKLYNNINTCAYMDKLNNKTKCLIKGLGHYKSPEQLRSTLVQIIFSYNICLWNVNGEMNIFYLQMSYCFSNDGEEFLVCDLVRMNVVLYDLQCFDPYQTIHWGGTVV